uniref:Uncharacterized protein n=1 Tax=Kalanchoe fedtschenkoi TaxID=63787 RepID=A0A7N0TAX6_KALFE
MQVVVSGPCGVMDVIDESGYSADSSKVSEDSVDQTEPVIIRAAEIITGSLRSGEPSAVVPTDASQLSKLDKSIFSFSSASQSSTVSYETLEPRDSNINDTDSEACLDDQSVPGDNEADNNAQSSPVNKHGQQHSARPSCDVSDVTLESALMSPMQGPPLQLMDRSGSYEPGRISSSVFTANSTPQEWSAASNESLFSLNVGSLNFNNGVSMGATIRKSSDYAISGELMSGRPSMVAQQETRGAVGRGHAGPSSTDNSTHDLIIQKIHDHIDARQHLPEMSWDPRKNKGRIQPLPPSVVKKPEKPSKCCQKLSSCCSCDRSSCCCVSSGFCCSRPRCGWCKMPSCSGSNCSSGWCCNWNCCSKRTCCSFNCCSKWSCCLKGSCCPSCSNCSNAICFWNWSCWKLLCCWNWNCCFKGSCCKSWSCCSEGSCCKSGSCCSIEKCCGCWSCCSIEKCCGCWSCCSKGTCCGKWNCCPKGRCCGSWNCFSKGTCCGSWNCCSKGTCCGSWNCCSKGKCCGSWNCFKGSCCKSWTCCPRGSCCKSWSCCKSGSCCPTWNCCSTGICSWKCGSCCQGWNCSTTGGCCCCSSSPKTKEGRGGQEKAHRHQTKTLGGGICSWFFCSGRSCC